MQNRIIEMRIFRSIIALLVIGILTVTVAFAQNVPSTLSNSPYQCKHNQLKNRLLKMDPTYQQQQADFQKEYANFVKRKRQQSSASRNSRPPIYTIPLVIHIFNNGAALGTQGNPTDATIEALIAETSQRFRHTHPGARQYNNPNYGIDTEIEFCIAQINRYTEIIPTAGREWYNVSYDLLDRFGADFNRIVNVYIVDGVNTCGGAAPRAGVIATPECLQSGLLAHEFGHYFSLLHTFDNGCANGDCLTNGDGVCDTPPKPSAGTSNPCGGTGNTCNTDEDDTSANNPYRSISLGGLGGQPDMLENYMDYTATCWDAFTRGQSDRMRLYLETTLSGLLNDATACSNTDSDGDGFSDLLDACPGFDDALINTSCDDNDANTANDIYTTNCECKGVFQDSDNDGVGDGDDQCPGFDDRFIGTLCDDGNPFTVQDFYQGCNCQGLPDTDGDGIADANDPCPNLAQNLIGTSCDDGNSSTLDDIYREDCTCLGFPDSDNDGISDVKDQCPGFDNNLIGTTCNDNNATTANDVYRSSCNCAGTACPAIPSAPPLIANSITNECLMTTVDLNDLHVNFIPIGTQLIWSTDSDPTNGVNGQVSMPISNPGTYYAYYFSGSDNCYSPASVAVQFTFDPTKILTAPVIGTNQTILRGAIPNPITILTNASGSGTFSYQWQRSFSNCNQDFSDILGATNITYNPVAQDINTYYRLVVTATNGTEQCSVISNCTAVTITPVTDLTICQGTDISPIVITQSAGVGNYTYQWQQSTNSCATGFIDIPGANSLTYDPPILIQTTYYRLVSTDLSNGPDCEEVSNCIRVIVTPALNVSLSAPNTDPVCFRASTPITSTVSGGTGPYTYQWDPTIGLNDATDANPIASPEFSTLYAVTVTDANGCSIQDQVEITVNVSLVDTDGDGLTDCEETTGRDNISTVAQPPGRTSNPNDSCDPFATGADCGEEGCSITAPRVIFNQN